MTAREPWFPARRWRPFCAFCVLLFALTFWLAWPRWWAGVALWGLTVGGGLIYALITRRAAGSQSVPRP